MTQLAPRVYTYPTTSSANIAPYEAHDRKLVVLRCPNDVRSTCAAYDVITSVRDHYLVSPSKLPYKELFRSTMFDKMNE